MKERGCRPGLLDVFLVGLFLVPAAAFLTTTADPLLYFRVKVLDGQAIYVISKVVGLYAVLLLWLQLLGGLLMSCARTSPSGMHRTLGVAAIGMGIAHAGLFVSAVSLRNGQVAAELLLPRFGGGYYVTLVSLGVIGLWVLIAVVVAAAVRNKFPGVWRGIHWLSVPGLALVLGHSFFIGTETRVGAMPYLYAVMLLSIPVAVVLRQRSRSARETVVGAVRSKSGRFS